MNFQGTQARALWKSIHDVTSEMMILARVMSEVWTNFLDSSEMVVRYLCDGDLLLHAHSCIKDGRDS